MDVKLLSYKLTLNWQSYSLFCLAISDEEKKVFFLQIRNQVLKTEHDGEEVMEDLVPML
jgi:hypothetical protein